MTDQRTYGTYGYQPASLASGDKRGRWVIAADPAVRLRIRRILGRLSTTRTSMLTVADTTEVARDLAWILERWPMKPINPHSERYLQQAAAAYVDLEQDVGGIIGGAPVRLELARDPLKTPREYQLRAVELLRARRRYLLTDEVGLGKTLTGLLNLVHEDALPAVVVAPTHLPSRWVAELEDAMPWLTYEVAKKTTPSARAVRHDLADVTIMSYSKLDGWAATLSDQVRSVMFDEAQELRNGTATDKGKAAALLASHATYVLGLTATPVYNYAGEIWNVLDIIAEGQLGTREEFLREWGVTGNGHIRNPATLGSYIREQGLMFGRTRMEVGRELPKTIKVPYVIDSDSAVIEEARKSVEHLARILLSDTATGAQKMQAGGTIDWQMRQATGVAKAPFVADFVRLLLESEGKVLLFGWHRDVYDVWMDELAEFKPRLYTGSESPKQKVDAEEAFKTGDCRVLIMSLRSGAGVDGLQKVSRVAVFGELDWSPQVHEQAIGRLRRDGMGDDPPIAYFLNSADGSDPPILEVLGVKRQQAEPLLSKDGKVFQNATTDPHRARRLAEQILGITRTETP
ncbi:ATP-dependent helicase [Rathayibacter sp. VKM Ac-2803]|uniref:SNF2-related protein n=1 Tax=Rathayibacter sp. VKM Ac-2803 TaxID=2609256 RepID=UPI00135CA363|nr:DEAD/DEAH box helicase [Rathayibacter sp. VKM Ac-2803]MWV50085.1 ATP-dependent helicase [Rathayibacter sp. VKM Ac-2803]